MHVVKHAATGVPAKAAATQPVCTRPARQPLTLRPQLPRLPQRGGATCAAAAAQDGVSEATAVAEPVAAVKSSKTMPQKPQAVTRAWQGALDLLQSGESFTTKIVGLNKSGVVVSVGGINGFVPYKLLDRARTANRGRYDSAVWSKLLVGKEIVVKVTQVVVPERRLICSEKAAMLDAAAGLMTPGEVLIGRVISLHDFGAFIEVATPPYTGAEVVLPVREVSWDWIANVNVALARGDELRVVVLSVQPPPRGKVVVSLKRMQEDPLKETLDQVLPLEGGLGYAGVAQVPATIPAAVEDILDELSRQEGVAGVELGRRVEERRTVSQDLELWMTRDAVADGYNLLARTGRIVQEIHVTTDMTSDAMKATVQRVLQRVT